MNELMWRRRALIAAQGGGLPSAYQQVEWIGFDGNSYLHLGECTFNSNPGFFVDFEVSSRINSYGPHIIGSTPIVLTFVARETANGLVALKGISNAVLPNFSAGVRYAVELEDETVTVNGAAYQVNAGDVTTGNLYVGCYAATPSDANFRLKGKIYGELNLMDGTAKVATLIPCYHKADGEIGMYDLVSKTFLANAGTGTFGKGADVN